MPPRRPTARRQTPRRLASVPLHLLLSLLLLPLLVATTSGAAHAGTDQLSYDLRFDLPITLGAGVVWLGSDLIGDRFAPDSCRWCASNPLDDKIRSTLGWGDPRVAQTAGNYLAYVGLPLLELGLLALSPVHDERSGELGGNVLVVGESVAIAGVFSQLAKYTFGRERPFVHALPEDQKPLTDDPKDNNLSFYSGHTSFAFALAGSAGSVATLRGYQFAPAVWAVGGVAAVATGYLRIAADRHYFTDVLAGAVMGTAVGVGVPVLFHRKREGEPVALVPMVDRRGSGLALVGRW